MAAQINGTKRASINPTIALMATYSRTGHLFERVLELEFSCNNFAVSWSDVTAEEVVGLQILKDERDRYQREQQADPNKVSPEEARMMRLSDRQRRQ